MVLTPSKMIDLNSKAPHFSLKAPTGDRVYRWEEAVIGKKGFLMAFICNHCPYVKHVMPVLAPLMNAYNSKDIACFAINSNDVEAYPEDAPDKMLQWVESYNFNFPYLFDEEQSVARAYGAECTPDFFLFDTQGACFYRGRLDESRPGGTVELTGQDLNQAVEALRSGAKPPSEQFPSLGCNIKWKAS